MLLEQGSPTPGPQTISGPRPVRNRAAQQEASGGHCRSPSFSLPHEPSQKLSSTKAVPGAKKGGDRCLGI